MALAEKDAALTLADGRVVYPDGSVSKPVRKTIEVPSNSAAQRAVFNANKRLADLPSLPAQLNTMSVVLVYSMWGLVDQDIALATGLTIGQITSIRAQDVYVKLRDDMLAAIKASDTDTIRAKINEKAESAINRIAELIDSEDEKVALGASKDILDRDGHRPADVVEHRHMMMDSLKIEVIRKDTNEIPTLDLIPIEVEDGDSL